ncbi:MULTISPECIES: DeoR/GlpR family DNA-binding transcription regulator [Silvimonas]|uniref:DeoR/GlpR family DNA-binding transcription regulator n=1 Tax=Silvimonas TaxID=300264 RepID=UPI0024B37C97|nr:MULTISPECIES: DeoR/GlpR family DNA-binding transcription regulator [Silvimonas]MDR3427399.1 DeoR/GlpR family DNA-binding transcription regulator [Silvimonas sp.]
MLTRQRKQHLLAVLKRDGQIQARAISQELGLSEDTIRRDLRELAAEGLLQRVHGGALPASPAVGDFAQRQQIASAAKAAIAKAAAGLISDGQIVILDGGTTAVQLARSLPATLRATVVTHSPSVAVELVQHAGVDVVMIGGRLFKHSIVNVGAAALESLAHIRADIFFMGVTGVHASEGLSTGDMEEAYMKRALMARAAETVVLASSEKLNAASPYVIAPITEASTIIVERDTKPALLNAFINAGTHILLA